MHTLAGAAATSTVARPHLRLEGLLVKGLVRAAQQLLQQPPAGGVGEQLPEHPPQRLGVHLDL
jgi:hypothetical protein